MTKEELQNLISIQQDQIDDLKDKIEKMRQLPEEVIRESALYQELQRENRSLKEDNTFYRTAAKIAESGQVRKQAQMDKLKAKCVAIEADNKKIAKMYNTSYWTGMTEKLDSRSERLDRENDDLIQQCTALKAKVESSDRYINHLENQLSALLYALRPEEAPKRHPEPAVEKSKRAGRPRKASKWQIDEARKWRKDGHSIREIARMTEEIWGKENRWSVSYVQKIVGDQKLVKDVKGCKTKTNL